jgi:hypothetical protein
MSKRKPAKASKQARSKVASKAQRASQAVVRSPKPSHRQIAAGSTMAPELHKDPRPDTPVLEKPVAALPVLENPAIASQDDSQRPVRDNEFTKPFDVSSAPANIGTYPTKLPELVRGQMQLALEFVQRLAQMKSPFEFPSVFSELTIKQFAMFQNLVFPARVRGERQKTDVEQPRITPV